MYISGTICCAVCRNITLSFPFTEVREHLFFSPSEAAQGRGKETLLRLNTKENKQLQYVYSLKP